MDENGKLKLWEKIGEEVIAQGYEKRFLKAVFRNPTTGEKEDFFFFDQPDWSTILPVTKDGIVVAIREYNQACNKITTGLPGGTFKTEEKAEETVKRELLEETGYMAKEIIFLGPPLWMASRNSKTRFWPFLGLGCEKVKKEKHDDSEEIETLLIPLKKWIEMAKTEIEQPSSVIATYRALSYLNI